MIVLVIGAGELYTMDGMCPEQAVVDDSRMGHKHGSTPHRDTVSAVGA